MKTDDLIQALTQDMTPQAGPSRLMRFLALPAALAVSMGVFFTTMSLRPHLGEAAVAQAVGIKLAITVSMTIAGLVLASRLMRPEAKPGALYSVLALPLGVLVGALAWDLSRNGLDHVSVRILGQNWWRCMLAIPMLSLAPLAALIYLFQRGAPSKPALAGAFTGFAGAGIAASIYALHCPDDSPLFILAWYSLATLIVATLGRWGGTRFLRW